MIRDGIAAGRVGPEHAQRVTAMRTRILSKVVQLACLPVAIGIITGCTATSSPARHHAPLHRASRATLQQRLQPLTSAAAAHCPKTIIRRAIEPPGSSVAPVPGTSVYGNGKLFVTLSMNGEIVVPTEMINPDGSLSWKFPWWRLVHGELTITGRRLDAPAPPLVPDVPAGYGNVGFQASGVTFPSEGCWQISGTVAHSSVTFVALVTKNATGA